MAIAFALLVLSLLLRTTTPNRHVRGRLNVSAFAFAIAALSAAALFSDRISASMQEQLATIRPLLLAFGVINGVVALIINPWRHDRVPDRFPRIVQDAIVIGLFAFGATLLLQDKIFAATAAGAVVVGLALQGTLGNLFAGLAIQIEKPFRVGHWVQIAGTDGQVSEVTWRATRIRTKAGNFVIVPNSKLADDIIVNYSEPTSESRIEVEVGVTYDAAPNRVKAIILDAIKDEPLISASRPPEVLLVDFASSSMNYRIRVWTDDFAADERLRDGIRSAVYYAFKRHRIEIPYPMQVEYARHEVPPSDRIDAASAVALGQVSIFAALDPTQKEALERAATSGVYAEGTVVVRQGAEGASMFVVVRGEVAVSLEPERQELARIGEDGFFGEMSLLTGEPRNATVTTTRDSQLLEITAEAFRHVVLANPAAVEQVGTAASARRTELDAHRATMGVVLPLETPHSLLTTIRRFLRLD